MKGLPASTGWQWLKQGFALFRLGKDVELVIGLTLQLRYPTDWSSLRYFLTPQFTPYRSR